MTYRRVPNNHKTHSSLSLFEQQHVSTSNNLGHCWVSQRNIVYYQLPYGSGRSVYLHELCSESSLHTNCGLSTIGFIVSIILERSHLNNLNLYQIQSCFSFESNQIACELRHCYINRKKEQSYQNVLRSYHCVLHCEATHWLWTQLILRHKITSLITGLYSSSCTAQKL